MGKMSEVDLLSALTFQIVLARSCVDIAAHFWYQMKVDELNFVKMEIIFCKLFNFGGKITALSGFRFIGTHCTIKLLNNSGTVYLNITIYNEENG